LFSRLRVPPLGHVLRHFAVIPPPAWRKAVRMTAAVLAYLDTARFGLPEGYWAVITCLVIGQGLLGATLDAGISRTYGTVVGGVSGGAGAWVHARFGHCHGNRGWRPGRRRSRLAA
jgi:uncharacterized membrane protein YccC